MAKYIIDLNPDCVDGEFLKIPIRVAGENMWIKTKASLTPYTEPDEDEIRQMAHEEAWDFATSCIDMDGNDFYRCFESDTVYYLTECTYSEAKAKYDAWKKQKDEIRVGDELEQTTVGGIHTGTTCVVVKIDGDNKMNGIRKDGSVVVCSSQVKRWWTKTGRSFPEVAELLKKMGEE